MHSPEHLPLQPTLSHPNSSSMNRPPRSRAATQHDYERAYKACIPCRQRKVKCRLSDETSRPCSRCKRMRLDCSFTEKLPWAREKRSLPGEDQSVSRAQDEGDQRRSLPHARSNTPCMPHGSLRKPVSSSNDALSILFQVAQQEARPDTLDTSANENLEALDVWNACRFVKMGWFTANEAIYLIDLFFKNMSPLSPILTDFYASSQNHYWLVTQEPMLCSTILMLSTSHHILPGPGGSSRAYSIHHRLWKHCEHLILRIVLGQEKLSKAKTRNLGTIEALLLISEWYPRALYFPPESDGWDSDLMLTVPDYRDPPTEEMPMSDRWKEDVVEPTRRSDRMSWMLVNTAVGLAHELGVFGSSSFQGGRMRDAMSGPDVNSYIENLERRCERLPGLLFVFVNLLASRIGCTSTMPSEPEKLSSSPSAEDDSKWLAFMDSWKDLTKMTKSITDQYFPQNHANIKGNAENRASLQYWRSLLSDWKGNLSDLEGSFYENVIYIEYHYLRVFTISIGMQECVERLLLEQTQSQSQSQTKDNPTSASLNEYLTPNSRSMIEDVISSSCCILRRILHINNCPDTPIQYLPSRVFLRVISSSIFLLKALALGTRASDVHSSIDLLEKTTTSLQFSRLEDLHLVSRYAVLLQVHVSRLRQTLATHSLITSKPDSVVHMTEKPCNNNNNNKSNDNNDDTTDYPQDLAPNNYPHIETWQPNETNELDLPWPGEDTTIIPDEWLSLPLDPMMAPFGTWDPSAPVDGNFYGLDSMHLDLDFIWNLPP